MIVRRFLVAAACLVCLAANAHAQGKDEQNQFIDQYKCAITERLEHLHALTRGRNRFLIVEMVGREQSFVQCLLSDSKPPKNAMLCEAASGFYEARRNKVPFVKMPEASLAALAALGFATDDAEGNHRREIAYKGPEEFGMVAELLLRALFHAYGARLGMPITLNSPLAQIDQTRSRCVPTG